jgi:hypothetical protein
MRTRTARKALASGSGGGWIRSSRCTPDNNCVELRLRHDGASVRDSKNAGGEVLIFARERWICFLGRVVR